MKSLDIDPEECRRIGLNILDLQLMPQMRDPKDPNIMTSLMKTVNAYCGHRIQECDPIIRQFGFRSPEINSRSTMKVGIRFLMYLWEYIESNGKVNKLLDYNQIHQKWILGIRQGKVKLNEKALRGRTLREIESIHKKW